MVNTVFALMLNNEQQQGRRESAHLLHMYGGQPPCEGPRTKWHKDLQAVWGLPLSPDTLKEHRRTHSMTPGTKVMGVTKAHKEGKDIHISTEGQPKAEEPPTLDYEQLLLLLLQLLHTAALPASLPANSLANYVSPVMYNMQNKATVRVWFYS